MDYGSKKITGIRARWGLEPWEGARRVGREGQ